MKQLVALKMEEKIVTKLILAVLTNKQKKTTAYFPIGEELHAGIAQLASMDARSCNMQLLGGSWFMQHAVGQSIKEMDGSMQLLGAPWRPVWRRNSQPHFWQRNLWRVAADCRGSGEPIVSNQPNTYQSCCGKPNVKHGKLWPATKHPL